MFVDGLVLITCCKQCREGAAHDVGRFTAQPQWSTVSVGLRMEPLAVTGGESPGSSAPSTYGLGPRRYVAHADASAPSIPRTGAFTPRPTSGVEIQF